MGYPFLLIPAGKGELESPETLIGNLQLAYEDLPCVVEATNDEAGTEVGGKIDFSPI